MSISHEYNSKIPFRLNRGKAAIAGLISVAFLGGYWAFQAGSSSTKLQDELGSKPLRKEVRVTRSGQAQSNGGGNYDSPPADSVPQIPFRGAITR